MPKPLEFISEKKTLLEAYLSLPFVRQFTRVIIICEPGFESCFQNELHNHVDHCETDLVLSATGTSTLEKLRHFVNVANDLMSPTVFTYPDIFVGGSLNVRSLLAEAHSSATITVVPLRPKFPRVFLAPYSAKALSVTTRQERNPANPVFLFAGHLIGTPSFFSKALAYPYLQRKIQDYSLENDFLSHLIDLNSLSYHKILDAYVKFDGPRDSLNVLNLL